MRKILLILTVVCLCGCTGSANKWTNPNADDNDNAVKYGAGAKVIVVNGCQYIVYQGNNSGDCAMVHAGNCNNPEHKNVKP